ncbi:hypothetical protein BH11PSE10_BH11PSE10_20630 [soil metagenome]
MDRALISAFGLAALLSFGSASAGRVTYDEAVSGDLNAALPHTFTLSAGVNTISGTTGIYRNSSAEGFSVDWDPFGLVVPTGMTVTTARLVMAPVYGVLAYPDWMVIKDGDWTTPQEFRVNYDYPVHVEQLLDVDLSPASYYFHHSSMGGQLDSQYTYSFKFDAVAAAASVPEPSSLAASLAAFGALAVAQRRRRRPNVG